MCHPAQNLESGTYDHEGMATTLRIGRIFWLILVAYSTVAPWFDVPESGLVAVSANEILDHMAFRLLCVPHRVENVIDISDSLAGG